MFSCLEGMLHKAIKKIEKIIENHHAFKTSRENPTLNDTNYPKKFWFVQESGANSYFFSNAICLGDRHGNIYGSSPKQPVQGEAPLICVAECKCWLVPVT